MLADDSNFPPVTTGATMWLTGLSGAGKSTIAQALCRTLRRNNLTSVALDGDALRQGLNSDLGYDDTARHENIRRTAEVAKLLASQGYIVICACISPHERNRRFARQCHLDHNIPFMEIFLDTPLTICEQRDPKQLYRRARAGEIEHFTGISSPYEPPQNADLILHAHTQHISASINACLTLLRQHAPHYTPHLR